MPLMKCTEKNKPGFKWGQSGKCYTYNANNETEKDQAKEKALEQGRAIEVNKVDNWIEKKFINKI